MRGAILAMAAVALTAAAAVPKAPSDEEDASALAVTVAETTKRAETIRGQRPGTVLGGVRADAAARRAAAAGRPAPVDAARLAARGRAWSDIGLGGIDSPAMLASILASDLDAIILHPTESTVLVDPERLTSRDFGPEAEGSEGSSLLLATGVRPDEPALVHAILHAIQRKQKRWPPAAETTDGTLAEGAWLEGESTLVALLFLVDGVGLGDEVLAGRFDPAEACNGTLFPSAIGESDGAVAALARFVFQEGFYASGEIVRRSGFAALIPEARSRRTTRDLMHLDRAPAPPVPVVPAFVPPEGYVLADQDRLGEQAVVVLVSLLTGKDNLGLMAGDGWAGDALQRWERPGGPGITTLDGARGRLRRRPPTSPTGSSERSRRGSPKDRSLPPGRGESGSTPRGRSIASTSWGRR